MIRILLAVAIAAAAYFGPWMVDSTGNILGGQFIQTAAYGDNFVQPTLTCVMDGVISVNDDCAPNYGTLGLLVTATIALGVASAVLSILGLLPFVGRLTSVVTIISGAVAVATLGWFAKELLTTDGAALADFGWGGYATGVFGLLTVLAGLNGLGGNKD